MLNQVTTKKTKTTNNDTLLHNSPLSFSTPLQKQISIPMSLAEYQSQLSDIELLLEDAPEDESLLKLKSDLLELIQLTAADEANDETNTDGGGLGASREATAGELDVKNATDKTTEGAAEAETKGPAKLDKKMKKKINKDFEIPEHLLPLESDTEAQRNKKRRTVKSLKSKHKAAQKEFESNKKQASWLDFSKKKRKKSKQTGSIFKTADDGGGKVGVVTSGSSAQGSSSTSNKRQRHIF
jgi:survival-of-motor-neuron-related-splicing factor 30